MKLIFLASFLLLNAQNKTPPAANPRLWSEIDKINIELKKVSKPVSDAEFTRWLERAWLVLKARYPLPFREGSGVMSLKCFSYFRKIYEKELLAP